MKAITQGTLIYGMRSSEYPGVMTYGIIISAACDLAQNKIDKVFYLTAVPVKDWLSSSKGFQLVISGRVSDCKKSLVNNLEKYELAWDVVETLSQSEFEKLVAEYMTKPDIKASLNYFANYRRLTKRNPTMEEKIEILCSEKKTVTNSLTEIFNGKHTHYSYIPTSAISESVSDGQGLIVDLLELDYLPMKTIRTIADGEMDCKKIEEQNIDYFDARFFITEEPGFAYPTGEILSPWREYVLQHFSNCFIRIGVDNPSREEVGDILDAMFHEEGKK